MFCMPWVLIEWVCNAGGRSQVPGHRARRPAGANGWCGRATRARLHRPDPRARPSAAPRDHRRDRCTQRLCTGPRPGAGARPARHRRDFIVSKPTRGCNRVPARPRGTSAGRDSAGDCVPAVSSRGAPPRPSRSVTTRMRAHRPVGDRTLRQ